MWKNALNTSGFQVTYSAFPPSEFVGWPDETHIFGMTDHGSELEEITLDSELTGIEICVDGYGNPTNNNHDFEGF